MEPITIMAGAMVLRMLAPVVKDGWKKITKAEAKEEQKRLMGEATEIRTKLELQPVPHTSLPCNNGSKRPITKGAGRCAILLKCRFVTRFLMINHILRM